jgi:hypothetical protein
MDVSVYYLFFYRAASVSSVPWSIREAGLVVITYYMQACSYSRGPLTTIPALMSIVVQPRKHSCSHSCYASSTVLTQLYSCINTVAHTVVQLHTHSCSHSSVSTVAHTYHTIYIYVAWGALARLNGGPSCALSAPRTASARAPPAPSAPLMGARLSCAPSAPRTAYACTRT